MFYEYRHIPLKKLGKIPNNATSILPQLLLTLFSIDIFPEDLDCDNLHKTTSGISSIFNFPAISNVTGHLVKMQNVFKFKIKRILLYQAIKLFRPMQHWPNKPITGHCFTGLGYTLAPQAAEFKMWPGGYSSPCALRQRGPSALTLCLIRMTTAVNTLSFVAISQPIKQQFIIINYNKLIYRLIN